MPKKETLNPMKNNKSYENIGVNAPTKSDQKHLGYIEQYLENTKMFFGKDYDYKKDVVNSNVSPNKMQWPTDALRNFLYDTSNGGNFIQNDKYQDPTYLGFDIMMIADESALFNYDETRPTSNSFANIASPQKFIEKYKNINEINQRGPLIEKFIKELKQYFAFTTDSDKTVLFNKKHYVEMIDGLDKLTHKITEYEKDVIEITMNEDVSLRMQYFIDLYNNITYDYRNKRGMIPENLLRFNMYIRIKDIRSFKVPNPSYDPKTDPQREKFLDSLDAFSGEFGGAYTLYKLHDCQFDFTDSQTHEGSISVAGWSTFNTSNMNNTKIKIKYKSILKIFESMLINDKEIVSLNNYNLSSLTREMNDYNNIFSTDNDYNTLRNIENGDTVYYNHDTSQKKEFAENTNISNERKDFIANKEKEKQNAKDDALLIEQKYLKQNEKRSGNGKNSDLSGFKSEHIGLENDISKKKFLERIKDRAKSAGSNFIEKKIADAEDLTNSLIRNGVGALNGKISEIRGSLITDLKHSIENSLPWDKLGNVYSTDFRQMSIQNFGKNLLSKSIDIAFDESDLMELSRVDINTPHVSFTKPSEPGDIKNRKEQSGNDSYLGKEKDILKNSNLKKPQINTNPNKDRPDAGDINIT